MTAAKNQAAIQDRERERLASIGVRSARPVSLRIRSAVLRAYKSGRSVEQAIADGLGPLRDALVSGMVAAHVQGRMRSAIVARRAGGLALADPFRSAVDFLKKRAELTPDQLVDIADEYGGDIDTVLQTLGANLGEKVNDAIRVSAQKGEHIAGGMQRIREAFDASGMGPKSDFAIETLYRTQVQTAYAAGKWHADQDPAVQDILWGYEYVTVGDDRVRPNHAAMDGFKAPKDDPIWRTWTPPCGFNCRCTLVSIFKDQPDAEASDPLPPTVNVDGVETVPGPDEGFDFNPGEVYRDVLGALA